jgi:hypothetical protein
MEIDLNVPGKSKYRTFFQTPPVTSSSIQPLEIWPTRTIQTHIHVHNLKGPRTTTAKLNTNNQDHKSRLHINDPPEERTGSGGFFGGGGGGWKNGQSSRAQD